MATGFSPRHIPALFIATTTTFGGALYPLASAAGSLREFGFPPRVQKSKEAQSVMIIGSARTACLGMLLYIFYWQGKYEEVDLILFLISSYLGVVDAWVVAKEGMPGKAWFRGISCAVIAAWSGLGMTAGRA